MTWGNKRVLVTGGAGFIGSALVERVVALGATATALDDLSNGRRENLNNANGRVQLLEADVRSVVWEDVLGREPFDLIVHLAANAYVPPSVEKPAWDYEINLGGTFRLLEALRKLQWPGTLIYASSAAVYGQGVRMPIHEDDPTVPIAPYGVGKLASERYVSVYSQLYGLRAASMRFFSVYGPRQRKQVVYDLIGRIVRDRSELFIYGDGTQVRDFCYVDDVAQAVLLAAQRGRLEGEAYNVASGRSCSLQELAEMLSRTLGAQPRFVYSNSVRPGDAEKWVVDIERLEALGYRSQVSLEDGLKRTIDWFLECQV